MRSPALAKDYQRCLLWVSEREIMVVAGAGLIKSSFSGHVFRKHAAPFASPPDERKPPIGGASANQQPHCSHSCAPVRLGTPFFAFYSLAGPVLIGGECEHVVIIMLVSS